MFTLSLSANSKDLRKKFDAELNSTSGGLWKHIEKKKLLALNGARRMVGVRSGRLQRSISWYHLKNASGQYAGLNADAPYALMHHQGTRPHQIRATKAKALRFQQRGVVVFRHSVMHPGTKPNPYLSAQLVHFRG